MNTKPIRSSRFFNTPHGAIPTLTIFVLPALDEGMTLSRAADTCRTTPASIPVVKIHAPVVLAAFSRPLRNTLASLGCRSKLVMPPYNFVNINLVKYLINIFHKIKKNNERE
jgi:hypothetical protein